MSSIKHFVGYNKGDEMGLEMGVVEKDKEKRTRIDRERERESLYH